MLRLPFFRRPAKETAAERAWRHVEWCLLGLLLLAKLLLFGRRFGTPIGFDASAYLEVVDRTSLAHPILGIRDTFYSFHPPLGFWMDRAAMLTGLDSLRATQLVVFLASVAAFLLLRETLRRLGLLRRPEGILFLYLSSALPLQVYMQGSINGDILILAFAALATLLCAMLFWLPCPTARRPWLVAALVGTLAAALHTKYSGLFLFAIPPVAAVLSGPARRKGVITALLACAVAGALCAPYYVLRNFRGEGQFFPVNMDWLLVDEMAVKRAMRDSEPLHYARMILTPSPLHVENIDERDYQIPRLFDAWRDFWHRETAFLGRAGPAEHLLSVLYMTAASALVMVGLAVFAWLPGGNPQWRRLSWTLFAVSALFTGALFWFCFTRPVFGPSKGVYVAPAMWAVGLLVAEALCRLPRSPFHGAERGNGRIFALAAFLAAFIAVNYGLPVY